MLTDAAIARLQSVATWPELPTDRYVVTEELGRGGMGAVYLAHDELLARDVAIKVSSAVASDEAEARLVREARILATLEHPGIVPVHDAGRLADGRLFYVMKRVRGKTLRAFVEDAPSLGNRLGVFERICDAVAFAHARGILHRDLTPDNVMVGAFGEVLVLDWGLASGPGGDAPGIVAGTRGFMAPEQSRGAAGEITERTDVFGLGGILDLLLAADVSTPRPLQAIRATALAPDPAGRYESVRALAADVARLRAGEAVSVYRESPLERAARVARAYRTPILLVIAYIVMRALVAWWLGT